MDTHAGDAQFDAVRCHFTEKETVELSLSVSQADFWNRVGDGFRRQPQTR